MSQKRNKVPKRFKGLKVEDTPVSDVVVEVVPSVCSNSSCCLSVYLRPMLWQTPIQTMQVECLAAPLHIPNPQPTLILPPAEVSPLVDNQQLSSWSASPSILGDVLHFIEHKAERQHLSAPSSNIPSPMNNPLPPPATSFSILDHVMGYISQHAPTSASSSPPSPLPKRVSILGDVLGFVAPNRSTSDPSFLPPAPSLDPSPEQKRHRKCHSRSKRRTPRS